jgi:SAM-dependent methyltransferase
MELWYGSVTHLPEVILWSAAALHPGLPVVWLSSRTRAGEKTMGRQSRFLRLLILLGCVALLFRVGAGVGGGGKSALAQLPVLENDIWLAPYVATPQEVVDRMLAMAEVRKTDVVYDLGSGDGRIVITAARRHGARGVGFELDEKLVRLARDNALRAGISGLVEFRHQDVMTVDLSPATVVTLYLLQDANLKLRPRLLSQLRSGARVVSHKFHMGDWQPEREETVHTETGDGHILYLWRIGPRRPSG